MFSRFSGAGIGVDGCRAGWFWVSLTESAATFGVAPEFPDILELGSSDTPVIVDIPIGLPSGPGYPRECDMRARRLLGRGRGSSVFNVPCREALETPDIDAARQVSRRLSGVAFSNQLWAIRPKILEVDRLLRSDSLAWERVRETHPELAFWALNDRAPSSRARNHIKRHASVGIYERDRARSGLAAGFGGRFGRARWPGSSSWEMTAGSGSWRYSAR